jgi:predicted AlkP superfamily pyrophosphatase or phosphodiesterase
MRILSLLGLFVATRLLAQATQPPLWTEPPRLVVGVVVDQMRTDLLYRYWDNFGDDGFKRLVMQGSFQRDAHFNYTPTVTGPGHASIYTGTTPSDHGIVANDRYDRQLRRTIYCVEDTAVRSVGTASTAGRRSPAQLLATTLADELELRFDGRSRTIGVALKDRSAILPIGRMGDAAYWFIGGEEGRFVSSTWYMDSLPAWVEGFNARHLAEAHLARTWEPLLPADRYHTPLADDNTYEIPLARGLRPTLPVDLDSLRKAGAGLELISYTPWGNTLTTDLALAAIEGEGLGRDAHTDLLAVSYSSPDILAHRVGPRAIELEDLYIRLDRELARLLQALDDQVGEGRYTLFLTADHGGADVPRFLQDRGASAGYVDLAEFRRTIDVELTRDARACIDTIIEGQVFLDRFYSEWDENVVLVTDAIARHPLVAGVTNTLLIPLHHGPDHLHELVMNGHMPGRSGDILISWLPGHFEREGWNAGRGTTHGSGWSYDTHVPVILFGRGVRAGEVLRRTAITDIAPTVAAIIGMARPNACSGDVVPEAVRSR